MGEGLREKVMKGLRCMSTPYEDLDDRDCENCKYDNASCFLDIPADALSLLKAQEPARPIIKQEMDDICSCIDNVAYCRKCGARIGRLKQNYCSNCGQAVKWDE